jgi:hypothetical protein
MIGVFLYYWLHLPFHVLSCYNLYVNDMLLDSCNDVMCFVHQAANVTHGDNRNVSYHMAPKEQFREHLFAILGY